MDTKGDGSNAGLRDAGVHLLVLRAGTNGQPAGLASFLPPAHFLLIYTWQPNLEAAAAESILRLM